MAYDEGIAGGLRDVFSRRVDAGGKKMFGGLAFMAAGIALLLLVTGCNKIYGEPSSIQINTADQISIKDAAIIEERLRQHATSFSPSFNFNRMAGKTLVEAHGAPPEAAIRFLLSHRGIFEVKAENGDLWFSQKDIVGAVAAFDSEQRPALKLRLSNDAGIRVARLSASYTGSKVSAILDGNILMVATVREPIGNGALMITGVKTTDEALMMTTMLKTGALSFLPESIQVRSRQQ